MSRRYRVGVIGFAHLHVNELVDRFAATGRSDIVACADTTPRTLSLITVEGSRTANLVRTLALPNAPRRHEDWRAMLATEALDIAILCPEISQHAEVAEAAAAAGAHIVTEKPLAGTLADAQRMQAAARAAGVALATNWPITWRPVIRRAKALIEAGAIGTVWQMKWRNNPSLGPLAHGSTHPGATVISGLVSDAEKASEWWHQHASGGGALLDYCCYGACLAAWFLGPIPTSVQGMTANLMSPGDAEDNATLLLRYPHALAIIEASWTNFHNGVPNGPIFYGTHGTIVVDGAELRIYRDRGVATPSAIETGEPLPAGVADIGHAFLHHLETGAPLHPTLDLPLNLAATAILDAGQRSAAASGLAVVPG